MERPVMSTLCYLSRGDELLLMLRNKKKQDPNEGKWIGVGGKFLEGETPDECLLREVFEETNVQLVDFSMHGVVVFISDKCYNEYMFLYTATKWNGEIAMDCEEGSLKWIKKSQILSLPLWEGDRYFLTPLLEGKRHIDLKLEYERERLVRVTDRSDV